jgi:cation transport protein ChaC
MALTAELVARCLRLEPDPGPEPGRHDFTEAEYDAASRALLERKPPGPLWIFAYGSLIWKPACETVEHQRATAFGWHRAFSLELTRWRGSRQQPGLMMALERGGRCDGLIYRLPRVGQAQQLRRLLRREVSGPNGARAVRWITVNAQGVRLRALSFWVGPAALDGKTRQPPDRVAHVLARACGHVGSGAEYLFHTVRELERHGIQDRGLWRLQQLVAAEILQLHPTFDGHSCRTD